MSHLPTGESVTIVVAMTEPATPKHLANLARFAEEVGSIGEVIVVDAVGSLKCIDIQLPNIRILFRPAGSLAPMLWRDGLLETDADFVAFTTSLMMPCPGWLDAFLHRLVETGSAGVGGPITPGPGLSPTDRAVGLLRYSNYFPPPLSPTCDEPPGDNALYRRSKLIEVESAWIDGFWEVDVHNALRDRGEWLSMAPDAAVIFAGGTSFVSMIRQRFRHALRYGCGRSRGWSGTARLSRVLACPIVPIVLGSRAIRTLRSRRIPLLHWLPSLPSFLLMASAWAIGEAVGFWRGVPDFSNDRRYDRATQLTGRAG